MPRPDAKENPTLMSVATNPVTRPLGATALLSRGLTPGKLRGLQRISNPNGTLTMLALDQNSSMIDMAAKAQKAKGIEGEPTYDEVVSAKLDLCRQMSPAASGVLIDAYYGAWAAVASFALPADKGLLVRVEKSGAPKNKAGGYLGQIEPGWSVEKIKLMGADAVKLLAQFEPGERESAEYQLAFLEHIYEECKRNDILCLLEPIAFPYDGEKKDEPRYLDRKAETVIESARQISRYCDVYKAEFPGTLGRESDEQLADNLLALSEASERPWVLLSAGVDYPQYYQQVQMAMESGCSGVLGGRAFWKEYFLQPDAEARTKFAAEEGLRRVSEVDKVVREHGTPWFARYGLTLEDLHSIRPAEGWHARYASQAKAAPGLDSGAPKYKAGEVY
jgi:tagatose 1,6-diphosphate aldolase